MEFSFDRSKDTAHLRNGTQSAGTPTQSQTPPQAAQQSQAKVPGDTSNEEIDTSTITNERLRKAIEKNRARQAERSRIQPQQQAQGSEAEAGPQQSSFFERQQPLPNTEQGPPQRSRAQERTHTGTPKVAAAVVTRRSVARPDEADFTPVKRTPRKVASQISYATSDRRKTKQMDPKLVGYLVKGCWIFCALMILRLIFANGGVVDFYSQRAISNDRILELDRIKKENMQIVREIERMQTDTAFQKKLVRDNLGFIAADEFLVLFPKEKSLQ